MCHSPGVQPRRRVTYVSLTRSTTAAEGDICVTRPERNRSGGCHMGHSPGAQPQRRVTYVSLARSATKAEGDICVTRPERSQGGG
eukprot:1184129-Prorocentrum_minimum.AAC.2